MNEININNTGANKSNGLQFKANLILEKIKEESNDKDGGEKEKSSALKNDEKVVVKIEANKGKIKEDEGKPKDVNPKEGKVEEEDNDVVVTCDEKFFSGLPNLENASTTEALDEILAENFIGETVKVDCRTYLGRKFGIRIVKI